MGLFDNLKRQAMNKVNTSSSQAINSLANAAGNAVRNMGNKKEKFKIQDLITVTNPNYSGSIPINFSVSAAKANVWQ